MAGRQRIEKEIPGIWTSRRMMSGTSVEAREGQRMGSERRTWAQDTRHSWCDAGRPNRMEAQEQGLCQGSEVTGGGQRSRTSKWLSAANSGGRGRREERGQGRWVPTGWLGAEDQGPGIKKAGEVTGTGSGCQEQNSVFTYSSCAPGSLSQVRPVLVFQAVSAPDGTSGQGWTSWLPNGQQVP